jgi:hypothetical protein
MTSVLVSIGRVGLASGSLTLRLDAVILVVCGVGSLCYGVLEVFKPSLPIRWQVRSTKKAHGVSRAVGTWFQQKLLRVDPDDEPWNDPRAQRSIRWVGVVLIIWSVALLAGAAVLWVR